MHFVKCEICGMKTSRVGGQKRTFMAKFPLDEDRCKRWVQVTGNEDLAHVPIEKLHELKYICGNHFRLRDFNKKMNHLKKNAIPSVLIPAKPLPDEILMGFPLHVFAPSKSTAVTATVGLGTSNSERNIPCNSRQVDSYNKENDSSLNELQCFLHDHTYSLPKGAIYVEIKRQSGEDIKEDQKLRVDDTPVAINDQCNDTNDNSNDYDDDDDVPNTPALEAESLPQELFSWEKMDVIVADNTEVKLEETVEAPEMTLDLGDVSMYKDEQPTKDCDNDTDPDGEFPEYRCNECRNEIKGFRYTCVQCADWDLCAACEARAAHATHYVLRVPGERPYKEMQAVLAAIRHQMLREDLFLPEMIASIKEELKDEDAEVPECVPEPEDDPLGAWSVSQLDDDDDCGTLEIYQERSDEDGRSPRKRLKTSLDHVANTQTLLPRDDSCYSNPETMTDYVLIQSIKDGTGNDVDPNRNSKFDYSDPIQIIDIDKLIKTHEQTEHTKQNDNDTMQATKEISTRTSQHRSSREDILDTSKPHNKRENFVDISNATPPLKILNFTSHTQDDTQGIRIGTHGTEIGTIETRYAGTHRYRLKMRRPQTADIGAHSTSNTDGEVKKRYKIRLPPGPHGKQFLVKMLKSRVTVELEDVMQKRKRKED